MEQILLLNAAKKRRKNIRAHEKYAVINGVEKRLCVHCGQYKDVSEFSRSSTASDGLNSWCTACSTKNQRELRDKKLEAALPQIRRKNVYDAACAFVEAYTAYYTGNNADILQYTQAMAAMRPILESLRPQ